MFKKKDGQQPQILIIDDEDAIRESFALYLEDNGYRVITGRDGQEGIDQFLEHSPDLVMVDLRMPRVDGFEVLRTVRATSSETPVIVISGTGAASDVVDALQAGATGFLNKPVWSLSHLITKINDALERQRLIEENREYQQGLETTITRLQTMQKQLVESEKMASLGKLVAGVAHEINTPVGIGVTAASHLSENISAFKKCYEAGDASHDDLERFLNTMDETARMILGNLSRAAQLIRSFKQVAVDQSSESPREFKLREYMEDILLSLKPRMKRTGHRIELACPEDLKIRSYPGALSQIITNLVMNALIHGFENKNNGTIDIRISKETPNIILVCTDNGKGMPEEVADNVFEPFFTTKRGTGGSGLGMHMVFNLVTQTLGGEIRCESEPDKGTRFVISFPHEEGPVQ
ncbi:MAG: hybrid sensor histidine kinase/response regulator [Deltaproteobacteria bacterium]|nr:hybrid sensor histidine kinase/response regulator [Deltaproteobacteria bacterium]